MVKVGDIVYDRRYYGDQARVTSIIDDKFTLSYGKALSIVSDDVVIVVAGKKCCACGCDVTVEDTPCEVDGHDVWLCNRCRK